MNSLNRLTPSTTITPLGASSGSSMSLPFNFPFSPLALGMGMFDHPTGSQSSNASNSIDSARILSLLHHQTMLAEELLKYRNILFGGSSASGSVSHGPASTGLNPFFNPFSPKPSVEVLRVPSSDRREHRDSNERKHSSKDIYDNIMSKRASIPPSTPTSTSEIDLSFNKEIRSGTSTPIIKARPESELLSDHSNSSVISAAAVSAMLIDPDELKCHICMAQFPSLWLLEQHTALQHSQLTGSEKPFKCEHCGQNYRYNCCQFQSALLQSHDQGTSNFNRSRIPADKLFTCDVCGMQFRYLKSFKKHRLNHALERLHGKKNKLPLLESSGELMVSSTNDGVETQKGPTDDEMVISEDEQDNTVDSMSNKHESNDQTFDPITSIPSENTGGDSTDKLNNSLSECDKPETSGNISSTEHEKKVSRQEPESTVSTGSTSFSMPQASNFQPQNSSLKSLLSAETITNQHLMGLNSQEVSILNFLRVDAAEKQRDKRFACPFCGKCVRSKENLKLHVRKHTGERPFVCLFCGRAFGGKSDLTRHLRIHTGERPYSCESCGKCFARADYLSKHLTTHVHNTQQQQSQR